MFLDVFSILVLLLGGFLFDFSVGCLDFNDFSGFSMQASLQFGRFGIVSA